MLLLVNVLGLVAAAAWIWAVVSAIRIVSLAPPGQRISTLFTLGWWRFDKVATVTGGKSVPLVPQYLWAFATFFAAVLAIALLSVMLASMSEDAAPAGQTAAEPKRINDPRVIAVRTADTVPYSTIPPLRNLSALAG